MDKKDIFYKISLTGDLGSGKSTICNILTKSLPAEVISIGGMQRALAKEKGMSTCDFNKYMEAHPEIDNLFDDRLKSYDSVSGKNLLFDSRLAWNFVPSAFSVYVTTDLFVAATRVFNARRDDEGYDSVEQAMQKLSERRASEMYRYSSIYGLNIKNLENYDLIVDSTSATPDEVVSVILSEYEKAFYGKPYHSRYYSPFRLYPLKTASREGDIEVFEYNDTYFVTAGLDALFRSIVKESSPQIGCTLLKLTDGQKKEKIANGLDEHFLKEWEASSGISFVRYPKI